MLRCRFEALLSALLALFARHPPADVRGARWWRANPGSAGGSGFEGAQQDIVLGVEELHKRRRLQFQLRTGEEIEGKQSDRQQTNYRNLRRQKSISRAFSAALLDRRRPARRHFFSSSNRPQPAANNGATAEAGGHNTTHNAAVIIFRAPFT